jgi:hypothetical protein
MTANLRRVLIALVTLTLLTVSLSSVVMAKNGGNQGGNSANAKLCYKGGWEDWVRSDHTTFANQNECVSYAANGGTLTPDPCEYDHDTALTGRTLYAIAYTNVNGIDGYQPDDCDVFISALAENNGNSAPDAGDEILFGRHPTAWDAPWGFASFAGTSVGTSSVRCEFGGIDAAANPYGFGGAYWDKLTDAWEQAGSNIDGGGFSFDDYNTADANDFFNGDQRSSPGDDPFLDVDLFVNCF